MNKTYLKNILKGLTGILIYFAVSNYAAVPLYALGIDPSKLPGYVTDIYSLFMEFLIILSIFLLFQKEITNSFKDLKKNHLKYFKKYLKYYLLAIIVMMGSNAIINVLGGGISENESAIRSSFQTSPVYVFIASVIFAPILEEFTFRGCFRAIFKNDTIFILVSGLIFGSLHLITMPLNELFPIYLISYSSCGIAFAYMLAKSNNIFVSTGFHFMHNGILMSLQTFLLFFS